MLIDVACAILEGTLSLHSTR